jgi:hypothetical protein
VGVEEGEEIQTKDIDNLFNKIESDIQVQEANRTPNCQKGNIPRHITIKTLNIQKKNYTESCKREKTGHIIKANPLE